MCVYVCVYIYKNFETLYVIAKNPNSRKCFLSTIYLI